MHANLRTNCHLLVSLEFQKLLLTAEYAPPKKKDDIENRVLDINWTIGGPSNRLIHPNNNILSKSFLDL